MSEEFKASSSSGAKDTGSDLKRFLIIVVVIFLPFLQARSTYQASIEREIIGNRMVMTSDGGKMVMDGARWFYNLVMDDLGVYRFLRNTLQDNQSGPKDAVEKMARTLLVVSDRIVENTPLLIYQVGFRLGVAAYWLVFMLPFLLGGIFSGVQYWRKAMDEPRGPKIERFMMYKTIATFSVWALIIYLLIPAAGAATWAKYLTPAGVIIFSLMINRMITGYHRMV